MDGDSFTDETTGATHFEPSVQRPLPVTVHLRYVDEDGRLAHEVSLTWDNPHTAMWAGNAALPDDDPRKITRAKVDALRTLLDHAEDHRECGGPWPDAEFNPVSDAAYEVLRALAALLPPE